MSPPLQINLDDLNPAQREAVVTTEGPLLVIAGAGSGKTRVIIYRIAYLVGEKGIPPWQIFASTFTNKAAGEMKHRIGRILPGMETARLTIGTFHSVCVSILRREASRVGLDTQFTIADQSDQKALVKDCLRELDIPKSEIQPEQVMNWISQAKTFMYTPEEARENLSAEWGPDYAKVYELYETRLARNNAVDFDDLLLKTVRLYQSDPEVLARYQERWKYFLIDEYQDINDVQFEFVRLLAEQEGNICVVGDEDQSIYSWRGADIENILQFDQRFEGARTIRLEQNYRSTQTILEAANLVIARNKQRKGKNLWTDRAGGDLITLVVGSTEREEAALVVETIGWLRRLRGVAFREFAIFYRVNALSRLYEDFLRQSSVPYRVVGGVRFYDRAEIKDLLSYLRLIANPHDGIALGRIINRPRRAIGEKTLNTLVAGAAAKNVSLWEHLCGSLEDVKLSTKARAGVISLVQMIHKWREMAENRTPVDLFHEVLHDTRYEDSLGDPHALETLSRKENIEELGRALEDFVAGAPDGTLGEYLEMVTLTAAVDEMTEEDDCVSLMTLHSAKGLEFPVVFLTGLEEGIFPSPRAMSEVGDLEEERRLFYVGVTRAMDHLFLTRADSRSLYGRTQYNPPSSFLLEVPEELTDSLEEMRRTTAKTGGDRAPSRMMSAEPGHAALEEPVAAAVDAAEPEGLFAAGSRVRHATLGEGEVLAVKGEGVKRKLAIRFDAGIELEVLEQFGGLEPAEDLPF